MSSLSDEILMAYVDGQLTDSERAEVKAIIESDPIVRQRLQIFEITGKNLSQLYEQPMHEPVPDWLILALGDNPVNGVKPGKAAQEVSGFSRMAKIFSGYFAANVVNWQAAVAACLLFTLGLGAGWWMTGPQPQPQPQMTAFISMDNGNLYAQGAFVQFLEKGFMGNTYELDRENGELKTARAEFSFRNHQQQFCRQYQITVNNTQHYAGLACRTNTGKWQVNIHTSINSNTPEEDSFVIAAKMRAPWIDAYVDKMMAGGILNRKVEAELIENNWEKTN